MIVHLVDGPNDGKAIRVIDTRRIGELREVVEKEYVDTPLGPIEEEILRVVCDGCGEVKHLDMERFGLDWPEQLEEWRTVEGVGDLCPACLHDWRGGDERGG